MENLTLSLFIALMAPLSMFLIFFKGDNRKIIVFLMFGLVMNLLSGEINGLILANSSINETYLATNIYPIIEETLKVLPIIFYVYVFKPNNKSILMCSLIIGIGFAILENAYILAQSNESSTIILAIFRGFGSGMMHAICTLLVGFGLTYVKKDNRLAVCGTFALLSLAIMYHSTYNCIMFSEMPIFGIVLTTVTFLPLILVLNKQKLG